MRGTYKLLIILAFIFSISAATVYAASPGIIEAIGGSSSVLVKREGKSLRLKKGDSIQVGDEVITDKLTAVDIRFEDEGQTILRVGANSSYRLVEDSKVKKTLHRLLSGIVRVLVPAKKEAKKDGDIRFQMNTPEGTIGVRGTEFVVIRSKGETKLKGLTGEVLFGPADGDFEHIGQFVLVTKGYESTVKAGQSPSKPAKYSLSNYLKELDSRSGSSFAPLAGRMKAEVIARAKVTKSAPAVKPTFSTAASVMSPVVSAPKEEQPKEEAPVVNYNELLLKAAILGDLENVANLVEQKKANVNFSDEEGNTPLHAATVHDRLEVMQYLIGKGAKVDVKNANGYTPLMGVSIDSGEVKTAMTLVQNGADIKETDREGRTALDLAKLKPEYSSLTEYLTELQKELNAEKK